MSNPFDCIANDTARCFTHRGINCMTQLGPYSINGYIELPENHPWLDFPDTLEVHPDIEVHGGITYEAGRIIGFDTNHLGDGQHPDAPHAHPSHFTGHTWTWEEVEEETRRLADQAKENTMPKPTRQEIISAHEALETLCARAPEDTPAYSMKSLILAALPPKPQPTMAGVEWDNDKHRFGEAEHFEYGGVIMLGMDPVIGNIKVLLNEYGEFKMRYAMPQDLTPTGKRYTLTEVIASYLKEIVLGDQDE